MKMHVTDGKTYTLYTNFKNLEPMTILKLQSAETIDQNGIIYYLTGEYSYMGKIESGDTRVLLDQNDGKLYMIEMNDLKINSLINL